MLFKGDAKSRAREREERKEAGEGEGEKIDRVFELRTMAKRREKRKEEIDVWENVVS